MTTESFEEHRQRLLRDENVQEMIRIRAFEIYHMRGVQPGGAAQDWFQAESEVLAFLLAHHPEQPTEEEVEPVAETPVADALTEAAAPKKRKPRAKSDSTTKETAARKAATKRTQPTKAPASKSKSKRPAKESKSEDKTA